MHYYFAPLEGLTDIHYRRLHSKCFPGITRYYTPFISPTMHHNLTQRELRELPPAESLGCCTVPQVLTKVSEDFIWFSQRARDLGYTEVNLNLGCPSGTVTAKGKGAGMLQDLSALDAFLDKIFSAAVTDISIKTRIGFQSPEEFPAILEIYNRYPIQELTVHSRVRKAFYNGAVDMETFAYALAESKNPVCYNGNLCTAEQIRQLGSRYPELKAVMLGRALIADPGMLTPGGTTAAALERFHRELLDSYIDAFGSPRNAMFRMKENWRYLICRFAGGERLGKRLRKTTDLEEYKEITHQIFSTLPLAEALNADW